MAEVSVLGLWEWKHQWVMCFSQQMTSGCLVCFWPVLSSLACSHVHLYCLCVLNYTFDWHASCCHWRHTLLCMPLNSHLRHAFQWLHRSVVSEGAQQLFHYHNSLWWTHFIDTQAAVAHVSILLMIILSLLSFTYNQNSISKELWKLLVKCYFT